jgi:hypothetical protein
MKKIVIGALVVVTASVAAIAGFYAWGMYVAYTECYAAFEAKGAAERAADAGAKEGFDTRAEFRDQPGAKWTVIFETGETGADAEEDRAAFRAIVKREGGRSAHPGGCGERTGLD